MYTYIYCFRIESFYQNVGFHVMYNMFVYICIHTHAKTFSLSLPPTLNVSLPQSFASFLSSLSLTPSLSSIHIYVFIHGLSNSLHIVNGIY